MTVVLLHGYALDRYSWDRIAPLLPEAVEEPPAVVAYDHRDHGKSGRAGRGTATMARLGDDLAEVLEREVPEGRVVLVGHDMGGLAIMALTQRHRKLFTARVAGLVLLATSSGGSPPRPRPRGRVRSECWRGTWNTCWARSCSGSCASTRGGRCGAALVALRRRSAAGAGRAVRGHDPAHLAAHRRRVPPGARRVRPRCGAGARGRPARDSHRGGAGPHRGGRGRRAPRRWPAARHGGGAARRRARRAATIRGTGPARIVASVREGRRQLRKS
ncbi:alpha/beta fold hydrolase [Amycolatopsis sp. NPDC004368]